MNLWQRPGLQVIFSIEDSDHELETENDVINNGCGFRPKFFALCVTYVPVLTLCDLCIRTPWGRGYTQIFGPPPTHFHLPTPLRHTHNNVGRLALYKVKKLFNQLQPS